MLGKTWGTVLKETPLLSSSAVRICCLRRLLLSTPVVLLRTGGGAHVTPKQLSHDQSDLIEIVCLHGNLLWNQINCTSLDFILCLYFHTQCENEESQHDYLSQMRSASLRPRFRTYHSLVFVGKKTVHESSDNVFYRKIRRAK